MGKRVWPFIAGATAGAAGVLLAQALTPRRRLDPRLVRALHAGGEVPPTVLVPGLLGSRLLRPDGTEAWLNLANAFGHHDLRLPLRLPFLRARMRSSLVASRSFVLPRCSASEVRRPRAPCSRAGFRHGSSGGPGCLRVHLRLAPRSLESARALGETLDSGPVMGQPRPFNLIGLA
jgi:hypothetical protein